MKIAGLMSSVFHGALLASQPAKMGGARRRPGFGIVSEGIEGAGGQGQTPSSPSTNSANSTSVGKDDGHGLGGGGFDDPLRAAINVRLLRRVLQAAGEDSRSLAAGIGIITEGASKREERLSRARASGVGVGTNSEHADGDDQLDTYPSDDVLSRGSNVGSREAEWEALGEGAEVEGAQKCAPPLTPAIEVAVRLFADGYNVAVMLQVSLGMDPAGSISVRWCFIRLELFSGTRGLVSWLKVLRVKAVTLSSSSSKGI